MGSAAKSTRGSGRIARARKGLAGILSRVRKLLGGRRVKLGRKASNLSPEVLNRVRKFARNIGQMIRR